MGDYLLALVSLFVETWLIIFHSQNTREKNCLASLSICCLSCQYSCRWLAFFFFFASQKLRRKARPNNHSPLMILDVSKARFRDLMVIGSEFGFLSAFLVIDAYCLVGDFQLTLSPAEKREQWSVLEIFVIARHKAGVSGASRATSSEKDASLFLINAHLRIDRKPIICRAR